VLLSEALLSEVLHLVAPLSEELRLVALVVKEVPRRRRGRSAVVRRVGKKEAKGTEKAKLTHNPRRLRQLLSQKLLAPLPRKEVPVRKLQQRLR
jgi:hypothetical protein